MKLTLGYASALPWVLPVWSATIAAADVRRKQNAPGSMAPVSVLRERFAGLVATGAVLAKSAVPAIIAILMDIVRDRLPTSFLIWQGALGESKRGVWDLDGQKEADVGAGVGAGSIYTSRWPGHVWPA